MNKKRSIWIGLIIGLLVVGIWIGPALIGRAFGLRAYTMMSDSMRPTIQKGDKVVIYNRAYRKRLPEVNNLIGFVTPENKDKIIIRRIKEKASSDSFYVSADGKYAKPYEAIPIKDIKGEIVLVYRNRRYIYNKFLNP